VSDVAGIVLHNVLKDPISSIEIWPRLKIHFFNSDYEEIFRSINKYYNKHNTLPTFDDLKLTLREQSIIQKIVALELLEVSDDIDNIVATEALTDQYTQDETLTQLSKFIDNIPTYDTMEVKNELANILLDLEQKTETSEEIFLMNDIFVIDNEEIHNRVMLGLNNSFDALTGGLSLTELVMIGGHRGSGKTVAACNIAINQYNQGNVGLFFSIEMRYREIFNRFISILSDVDNNKIKNMRCDPSEYMKIANARSNMFVDSEEVLQDYIRHKNYEKFEIDLVKSKRLKADNQLIIVDNQSLTMADIDLNITKFKMQFGSKLKVVVVDYVNQIQTPDIFDWKNQISMSKGLKALARKHDIVMVTPYQTDTTGEARFAKGLLDAADVAANLEANDDYITFSSTKTRNIAPFQFNAPIDWNTFTLLPMDAIIESDNGEKAQDAPI